MRLRVLLVFNLFFAGLAYAQSDPNLATVQEKLKEQGFYYGEATGQKDADTTASIRRYQIRNGLKVTGDLNAETQKSLGVKVTAAEPPRATPTPPMVRANPAPAVSEFRQNRNAVREPAPLMEENLADQSDSSIYQPDMRDLFAGTPYANASFETQRNVVARAQSLLARRGYYRAYIDGEFGPGTAFALRAFQSRFGIRSDGKFNHATLGALGLLPGQRAPGLTVTRPQSNWPQRARGIAPTGEPVYEPR